MQRESHTPDVASRTWERGGARPHCWDMLIKLPARAEPRKRALDWLIANEIGHLVLFQEVKIHDTRSAERFKLWLAERH